MQVGIATLPRDTGCVPLSSGASAQLFRWQLPALEAAAAALSQEWMVVLVGPPASGKTSVARHLATLAGANLKEVRESPPVSVERRKFRYMHSNEGVCAKLGTHAGRK